MSKILLVEDDINLREIYAARLKAEGYQVVAASDGEEALAKSVKEKPDLILLDIMMPKISGFDVLDILRSTPETKETRVVILTALSQQSERERGKSLGVNVYLIKSQITLEDVVQTIRDQLKATVSATGEVEQSEVFDNSQSALEKAAKTLKGRNNKVQIDSRPTLKNDKSNSNDDSAIDKSPPGSQNPNHKDKS